MPPHWNQVKDLTNLKNDWIRALYLYNKQNKKSYCIPKKGSAPYTKVKAIEAQIKQQRLESLQQS